jgi:hypothetical protein
MKEKRLPRKGWLFVIGRHYNLPTLKGENMLNTSVMRTSGRTFRLNLTSSASATLQITANTNDQTNLVSLLNTGTGIAAVQFANASGAIVSPTIATDGNSGSFILPAAMQMPLLVTCPPAPFFIKAKSSGTNALFITAAEVG